MPVAHRFDTDARQPLLPGSTFPGVPALPGLKSSHTTPDNPPAAAAGAAAGRASDGILSWGSATSGSVTEAPAG
ncbi:hypothetical protein ACU686_38705 [Yinghuangia aomiensis]